MFVRFCSIDYAVKLEEFVQVTWALSKSQRAIRVGRLTSESSLTLQPSGIQAFFSYIVSH